MTLGWAIVTGAGRGIGAVIARQVAAAGYTVAAWDTDEKSLHAIADDIGEACRPHLVDVTDEVAVNAAVDQMPVPPCLVVNNAGIARSGRLLDLPVSDWRSTLDVNLTGAFLVARSAARRMIADGRTGSIVNVASVNGLSAAPRLGAYSPSKAGLIMLTELMALEWAGMRVRVNAVAPGLIDAGMSERFRGDPAITRGRRERIPMGRFGTAADIAHVVMFLAADRSSYITGQTFSVDGGLGIAGLDRMPRE